MPRRHLIHAELTRSVIGAFYEVYNTLGFGFLEHVYVMAMVLELVERGHRIAREVPVRVLYKGCEVATQRIDVLVDETLIVEIKSTSELHNSARHQTYNYLRATSLEVALLLHFGPRPSFIRLICTNARRDPAPSAHPPDPFPPSSWMPGQGASAVESR
jgi:GxxExxY protein